MKQTKKHYNSFRVLEAKIRSCFILIGLFLKGLSVVFCVTDDQYIEASTGLGLPFQIREARATCSPRDEFNVWIGKMVALYKLTEKKMPRWVR